ncbi:MAG TPA: hypothetical protein VER76_15085 [Pyrinomonadaceae bacterium]|nr:hypothetical protein [Pyrinomonadaceae bacterium]
MVCSSDARASATRAVNAAKTGMSKRRRQEASPCPLQPVSESRWKTAIIADSGAICLSGSARPAREDEAACAARQGLLTVF